MSARELDLLRAAMICIEDGCPPDAGMQLCAMQEDDDDGTACGRCWQQYLVWLANGRVRDPYTREKIWEGGMVG